MYARQPELGERSIRVDRIDLSGRVFKHVKHTSTNGGENAGGDGVVLCLLRFHIDRPQRAHVRRQTLRGRVLKQHQGAHGLQNLASFPHQLHETSRMYARQPELGERSIRVDRIDLSGRVFKHVKHTSTNGGEMCHRLTATMTRHRYVN